MGLFSRLFNEFVDVIEWTDDTSDTMVYRFERYGNEIKYGAKLIVRESQYAVFVNEGEVADVLGPGTYELETRNLPILTTLQNWHHGFNSPFKAEVYFCNARRFTDLKWGTKHPLMLRDAEFGGLRLRAFGNYSVRIQDPLKFIREIVGTEGVFTTDEISNQLRNLITSRFATIIGGAGIPILDMAANYDQLGDFLTRRIAPEFSEYGLELTKLLVENISLPPSVSEALDKRTSMGMTGNLDRYLQYQTGVSMEQAAQNPGGGASEGIGMGVGLAMANRMNESVQSPQAVPPPVPQVAQFHVAEGDQAMGPYDVQELRQRAAIGGLTPSTLVWSPAMTDWAPASEVNELSDLFAQRPSSPPPLNRA
jgi:membrane protease subunit (stomatin/prohibitin family)